jgi:hypothetical protein
MNIYNFYRGPVGIVLYMIPDLLSPKAMHQSLGFLFPISYETPQPSIMIPRLYVQFVSP